MWNKMKMADAIMSVRREEIGLKRKILKVFEVP